MLSTILGYLIQDSEKGIVVFQPTVNIAQMSIRGRKFYIAFTLLNIRIKLLGLAQKQLHILASQLQPIFDRCLIHKILEITRYVCGFAQSDRPNLHQI